MAFNYEIEGELVCKVNGNGRFIAKKGCMVAYQGDFQFDKMLLGPDNGRGFLGGLVGQVTRKITKENIELMAISGNGVIYLAENAAHIVVINLDNDEFCIESENLLGFDEQLKYELRFVGVGVVSQKGMVTSCLKGTGRVIIKSQGNPIILESPCVVDPDAIVGWTGDRDPRIKTDVSWKTLVGQSSGESYQLDFNWKGSTVIVQPCERWHTNPHIVD